MKSQGRHIRVAFSLIFATTCTDRDLPLQPTASQPRFEIQDGAHSSGNRRFFFLPPLVPAPTFSGTSDGTRAPIVKVCEWSASAAACVARIAEFSMTGGTASQVIRYDAKDQLYVVNWPTSTCLSGACLDPAKTYRLRVLIGVAELGHADIKVVANSAGLNKVDTKRYVGVIQGSTLAVKFRIEQGAVVTARPGAPALVGSTGGTLTSANGNLGLIIPPVALSQSTAIAVAPMGEADPGILAGSVYDLQPSGTTFATPVTLTIHYDPDRIPVGEDESSLRLYENSGAGWERVPGSGPSLTDHTVSGAISHFSDAGAGMPVAMVEVLPESGCPYAGCTMQFVDSTFDAGGNVVSDRPVTWASTNTSVATVNETGLATCLNLGQTTITATSEGVTGTFVLDVVAMPVPVASVTVSPASASLEVGQTLLLSATTRDEAANLLDRYVNWASSDNGVVRVDAVLKTRDPGIVQVRGVGAGLATITATSEGQSGSSEITVTVAPPMPSVQVTPASAAFCVGQEGQFTATPLDANGNPLSGQTVTWATSDETVATVSSSGLVLGVGAGSALITATSDLASGTAPVTVINCP